MDFSLKATLSTPLILESIDFYRRVFGMKLVEEWDHPDDHGAILAFADSQEEAFLEIYFDEKSHNFSGLGLQFRTDSLTKFIESLPAEIQYEEPRLRPWGATYLYLRDPNDISVIVYGGGY